MAFVADADTAPEESCTSDQTTSNATPKAAWLVVAILFLLCIVSVLDRNVVTLLVGPIKRHFDLTDVQMSVVIGAAFAVPFGVLSIPVGWAVDRYQRRVIVAAGITAWSLATVATGLVRGYPALLFVRSCVGAGDATLAPVNSSMLSDLFPREKLALPLAIASMGFKAGQGAALVIGAALLFYISPESIFDLPLVGIVKGWQLVFILIGLPGLLFVPVIFLIREPVRRKIGARPVDGESSFRAYIQFVTRHWRLFVPHHLGEMLYISMAYTVIAWMPAYLIRVHGWPEKLAGGWLGTAFLIGPLLGMPLHGAAADYLLRRGWTDIHMRYPMVAALVGIPFAISSFLVTTPELAVVLVGIFIFIVSGYVSLPLTAIVSLVPSRLRGKTTAIVGLVCATTGAVLGPLMVATLTDRVFGDPKMVGKSIVTCLAILAPAVVILFAATLKPLRSLATTK